MNADARWQRTRELFDAVCERPLEQWEPLLHDLCDDPELVADTLELLWAQTAALGRLQPSLEAVFRQDDAAAWKVGRRLGPWRLSQLLDSGGMGTVFLAERADQLYRRQVAIKVLRHPRDPLLRARLAAESQILADLQHPGIARLYDAGLTDNGQPYLVMEYIDGQPLDRVCAGRQLGLAQRLALFEAVCRIVQAAHTRLVVHCDLKPNNILVRDDLQPVLLDFGIAQLLGEEAGHGSDSYVTPAYASPELASGRPATAASDIFSLGVILTELLAGRALARGIADVHSPVPAPSDLAGAELSWRRRLPGDLDAIARKACAPAPEQRYASAEALADDVARYLGGYPVRARISGRLRRFGLRLRRNRRTSVLAAVALVLAVGFVVWLGIERKRAQDSAAAAASVTEFLVAAFDAADPSIRGGESMSAREVLDLSARRVDHGLSASPLLRARLQAALGRAYRNLGQPREAETLLRQGAGGLVRAGAAGHEAAAAQAMLSAQLSDMRQYPQALATAGQALRLLDRDDDPGVRALALNAQARAYAGTEQHAEAERAFLASIALNDGVGEPSRRRNRIEAMVNLGDMYRAQGRLPQAQTTLRAALDSAERFKLGQGGEYQRGLRALSLVLFDQGRIDEALALAERNLALTRGLFGDDSSYTAAAEAELAGQYLDLGRYHLSERHFRSSRETSARVDGPQSRAYASKLYASGILEEARGDYPRAEALYRQALDLYRARLGQDHAETLGVEMVLARLLLRTDRTGEAQAPLQRVAQAWRASLDPDSPQLIALRLVEIEWLTRAGRHAEATRALDEFARTHPNLPPGLALRQQMQQALLAQRRGDRTAAELWQQAVQTFSQLYGADSTATAKWRIPLAESLLARGDRDAARVEVDRARPQLRELAGNSEFLRRIAVLEQQLVDSPIPALEAGAESSATAAGPSSVFPSQR